VPVTQATRVTMTTIFTLKGAEASTLNGQYLSIWQKTNRLRV